MNSTRGLQLLGAAIISAIAGAATGAQDLVKIRMSGRYYAEPATVHMTISVEPNADNRVLRIEADGENFFRATDLQLEGSHAPKTHTVSFKNVPAGNYMVRAQVLSRLEELARAEAPLVVISAR